MEFQALVESDFCVVQMLFTLIACLAVHGKERYVMIMPLEIVKTRKAVLAVDPKVCYGDGGGDGVSIGNLNIK